MSEKKPPRLRMLVIETDGAKSAVPPFNRDTQKLREKEAQNLGPLHPFKI